MPGFAARVEQCRCQWVIHGETNPGVLGSGWEVLALSNRDRPMIIGAYLAYGTGHHAASWRHPDTPVDGALDIRHYAAMAQCAERGLLDFIFLSDTPSVFNDDKEGFGGRVVGLEPITLLSALAMVTTDIGLVATASTTYNSPYNVARQFASLDHISQGRAGWNVVTTSKSQAAGNFGLSAHPAHDIRYDIADEFVEIAKQLWQTWPDEALIRNKDSGKFYDPLKRKFTSFKGEHLSLHGELNVAESPQRFPLIIQSGTSDRGIDLAARTAEVIFTAQTQISSSIDFSRRVKQKLSHYGRPTDAIRILPGISPYTARTKREAKSKYDALQQLIHPKLGLSMLADLLGGFDLTGYDLDGPLPELPDSNGNQSRRQLIEKMARQESLSIRQLYQRLTASRGHVAVVGTYEEVAEVLIEWFESGACDGFNLMPPTYPNDLNSFVEEVIPILQKRGVYKSAYGSGPLRSKLFQTQ